MTQDRHSAKYVADLVRLQDRDRFLTAQYAPAARRGHLLALYAFNTEVGRIRETVSEPLIGEMRLQWWRDLISRLSKGEQAPVGHPVGEALSEAITRWSLPREHFDTILSARSRDFDEEPPDDLPSLESYAEETSSKVNLLGLKILGVDDTISKNAAIHVGVAWALTGILRAVLFHARDNHILLPQTLMTTQGVETVQDLHTERSREAVALIVAELADAARSRLAEARKSLKSIDLAALPVLLPATLADAYLDGMAKWNYDVFDPRHALQRPAVARLMWNAWRKRY